MNNINPVLIMTIMLNATPVANLQAVVDKSYSFAHCTMGGYAQGEVSHGQA